MSARDHLQLSINGDTPSVILTATGWSVSVRWSRNRADNPYADAEEFAAFIVAACNAHDELVAALKWFIDDIDGTYTVMIDFDANVARARAALAKAEGQPS